MQHTKSSVVKDRKDRKVTENETSKNLDKNNKRRDSHQSYQPSRLSGNALALGGQSSNPSP